MADAEWSNSPNIVSDDESCRYFTHDPETYPDPTIFRPERFIKSDGHEPEPDPHRLAFGFGRRVCPGRIIADNTIYLTIAQSLAVFNMSKIVEDGRVIEPKVQASPGLTSHPEPFKIDVKPRSLHYEKLIRSLETIYPWQESDAKALETISID